MKKKAIKVSLLPLSIGSIIFVFVFLTETVISTFQFDLASRLVVYLIMSLILGLTICAGLSFFLPALNNSVIALRRMYHFENLSHPLLLKLSYEAPGTYHHSLNVATLAQKAAKSINADTLIVRIGAYYHDIGKTLAPSQYIENQSGSEIPQNDDAESIRKNASKIISHVKAGIDIAKNNHLPEEVINLIAQHHGTTKVLYFHEKAKEKGIRIKKTDLSYPGPVPQSKEAAILMFADSCEAAARAVTNLTEDRISEIVENAVDDKVAERQLYVTTFSDRDLLLVKESLKETLGSIYHQRFIKE